jgi:hypothetical protein
LRLIGNFIKQGQEKGEIASRESFSGNRFVECSQQEHSTKSLSEIGVTKHQASIYKSIDSIPDEIFEQEITEKKTAVFMTEAL